MNARELSIYKQGFQEGASTQRQETATHVFSFIIDHGELIPEEKCLQMLVEFLADKDFNKILGSEKESAVEDRQADFCSRPQPCGYMDGGFCDIACAGYKPAT